MYPRYQKFDALDSKHAIMLMVLIDLGFHTELPRYQSKWNMSQAESIDAVWMDNVLGKTYREMDYYAGRLQGEVRI